MTTTPAAPAGPALEPSGGSPPGEPVQAALARLVADGTLSAVQAEAVAAALESAAARPPARPR